MNNTVILFDIDYTLFNVGKYREIVFGKLQELLPEVERVPQIANDAYEEMRKKGWFEVNRFTQELLKRISTDLDPKILEEVWKDTSFLSEALYEEAEEVLRELSEKGYTLGIFSSGENDFQRSKIAKIVHFFEEEHIHVHTLKDEKISEIVEKYKGKQVILIDDYIPVIEKAKQADSGIITMWMKRGRLSEMVAPSKEFPPDYIITNLKQLLPIADPVV
jgi:FMN phosphatase YigB (HAD superfamily)